MNNKYSSYILHSFFAIAAFVFYHFVAFPLFLDYGIYGVGLTAGLLAIGLFLLPANQRTEWSVLLIGYLLLVRGLYHVEYKPIWQQILAWILLTLVLIGAAKVLVRKLPIRNLLIFSLIGGLLFSQFSQEELFFARKFQVLYESPQLYVDTNVDYYSLSLADTTGSGQLDIVTRGFTEDDLSDPAIIEDMTMPGRAPLQLEASRYLTYHFDTKQQEFVEIGKQTAIEQQLAKELARDYVGFPYYETQWIAGDNFINSYTDVRSDLLKRGFLQMDFFYRLEEELNVNFVDNLGANASYFNLINQALQEKQVPAFQSVDNVDNAVDNSVGIYELLVPKVDRVHLIQSMLPFGRTPFSALAVSEENIREQVTSWNRVQNALRGSSVSPSSKGNSVDNAEASLQVLIDELSNSGAIIIGSDNLTNDSAYPELVVYHNGLEVYQWQDSSTDSVDQQNKGWQVVARLTPETLRVLADGEFLLADITGDGLAEILLSGKPSQVLQLTTHVDKSDMAPGYRYGWQQLWVAQDDVFRFEAVTDDGLILALSQSYARNENRRYLTGYTFVATDANGGAYAMKPVWRTNNTVINVRSGDVNGDGVNELVAAYFREHRFSVLKEHGLPIQTLAWLLTGVTLLIAFICRYRTRQQNTDQQDTSIFSIDKRNVLVGSVILLFTMASAIGISDNSHISANGAVTLLDLNSQGTLSATDDGDARPINDWNNYWSNAVEYTDTNGERFWYSGWIVTKVQKRQTTSMYDGIVVKDDGILVNARMLGQPFRYYEANDTVYLFEDNRWQRLQYEAGYPVDWLGRYEQHKDTMGDRMDYRQPFTDLHILADLPNDVMVSPPQIVGEEAILGNLCDKITFTINTQNVSADDIPGLRIGNADATMEWTVWVGQDQPYIYQYNVETLLPVPNAGMMQQTTYFRFWNYNDDSIAMTDPLLIEKQIVERELRQIADIEHALQTEASREQLTDMEVRLLILRLTILKNNVDNSPVDTEDL